MQACILIKRRNIWQRKKRKAEAASQKNLEAGQ
nr:MAG TPA: hypothetical protein [Caudoviricetes sp.]